MRSWRQAPKQPDRVAAPRSAVDTLVRPATDGLQRSVGNQAVQELLRSPGQPLPPAVQAEMEGRFGEDFSGVQIHHGEAAARSAEGVTANAYTVGQHIVFGADRYAPETNAGRALLTHELAHVVQQSRGGVAPAPEAHGSTEEDARQASVAAVHGGGPVQVEASSGVGIARDDGSLDDPFEERFRRQLSLTFTLPWTGGAGLPAGPDKLTDPLGSDSLSPDGGWHLKLELPQRVADYFHKSWMGSDLLLGIGATRRTNAGGSFSAGLGLLSGESGTGIPPFPPPEPGSDYYQRPGAGASTLTEAAPLLWYDPGPSAGLHLKYSLPHSSTQLGFTFGFSPPDIPALVPYSPYSPHAAGDLGSVADSIFSRAFDYNKQTPYGWWIGGRFYITKW